MELLAEIGTKRSILRRLLEAFRVFCGGFVVYLAFGNMLGFALEGKHTTDEAICIPYLSFFWLFLSNCSDPLISKFWLVAVGIQRYLIVLPAVLIAGLRGATYNHLQFPEFYLGPG